VILLLRAGLAISPDTLRRIVGPALVFGLVPVAAELALATGIARAVLLPSWPLALLAGFLVAAVSPAVILPAMLRRQERFPEDPRAVSQQIMGQTVINAIAATIGILITLEAIASPAGSPGARRLLLLLPAALLVGALAGSLAAAFLRTERLADGGVRGGRAAAVLLGLVGAALYLGAGRVPWMDGVTATLALALAVRRRMGRDDVALRNALRRAWGVAEIVLFTNLGSAIRLEALADVGTVGMALPLLAAAVGGRWVVARVLARRFPFTPDERHLVAVSNLPKATIQAVFGALPLLTFAELRPGLVAQGEVLLVLAALAIVTTAPAGAWALERAMTPRRKRPLPPAVRPETARR